MGDNWLERFVEKDFVGEEVSSEDYNEDSDKGDVDNEEKDVDR